MFHFSINVSILNCITLHCDCDQAPAYYERHEKLIHEIKHLLLTEMEDSSQDDLIKRVQIVDTLQCLGIDGHFQHEIKTAALDYVYRLRVSRRMI